MSKDFLNRKLIKDEIEKIDRLLSMADIMIVKREESEKVYGKAIAQLYAVYKAMSRNIKLQVKLHKVGLRKRNRFGCKISYRNGEYWKDCPVEFTHLSMPLGVSIGAVSSKICSICREELLNCNHVKGKIYNQVKCVKTDGLCNICMKKNCEHVPGECYDNVPAVAIVKNLKFDHIALVDNPLDQEAGISSIAISRKDIYDEAFKRNYRFNWGDSLYCDHCLACKGISKRPGG